MRPAHEHCVGEPTRSTVAIIIVSGGSDVAQLAHEVQSLKSDDRRKIWEEMEFKIEIPALDGLALKADLCLPWNRMRTMKR